MIVVLATDGSKHAKSALSELCRRQWHPEIQFRLVAVAGGHLTPDAANSALQDASAKLQATFGSEHVQTSLLHGDVGDAIVRFCRQQQAQLLAVGAYGAGKVQRMFIGSVTDYVVHNAACNVLVVRERSDQASEHRHRPERILVCVDGQQSAASIIANLVEQKFHPATEFKFVHVFPPPVHAYSPDPAFDLKLFQSEEKKERARFEYGLKQLGARLQERTGNTIETCVLESEDTSQQIVYASTEFDVDLVVLGPREHTGIDEMLLGSVSKAVLSNAPCSVEIIKCRPPTANAADKR